MKIKVYEMNEVGVRTRFCVDGYNFTTSQFGDGLYYQGYNDHYNYYRKDEIIPPEFFSLNQNTKSGRWKAIKREFTEYGDYIKSYIEQLEKDKSHE